jgi:hypothetical protein
MVSQWIKPEGWLGERVHLAGRAAGQGDVSKKTK